MHRTTIRGDYGKGRWEEGGDLAKRPEKVAAG
jgi:hypothetical protein